MECIGLIELQRAKNIFKYTNSILMRSFILLLFLVFYFTQITPITAQVPSESEAIAMADVMRGNGKIYVVVATLTVILLGLLAYLIALDKKISYLSKKIKNKK